jgi:hypothetical protein
VLVPLVEGRSLSPRILKLRGRLASALGDSSGVDRALRETLNLYREIGATDLPRVAREIAARAKPPLVTPSQASPLFRAAEHDRPARH